MDETSEQTNMLFEFQPITKDTLKEIMLSLDHNKAFGHDIISVHS